MRFTLFSEKDSVDFETKIDRDGDLSIKANGVVLGYISSRTGKLHLYFLDETERERVTGLSLSNGKLTVAL